MTGRWGIGAGLGLVALGLLPGCGAANHRREPAPHATAALLDSGPAPKVTARQAGDVQFALGRSAEESGRLDGAAAAYRSALAKDSSRGDAEHRLAVVLDQQGRADEADEHFRRALKLAPKNPEILCDRGYGLHLRGRADEAERSLRAALALQGDHARSHANLGLVLAGRGREEDALAEFARAGIAPADARANLALALALGGHLEASRDQYARAATAGPASPLARAGRDGVASALKGRAGSGRDGLPPLPGAGAALADTGGTLDPAVRAASAEVSAR